MRGKRATRGTGEGVSAQLRAATQPRAALHCKSAVYGSSEMPSRPRYGVDPYPDGRFGTVSPEERAEQARHARSRLAVLRSVALGLDNARAVSDVLLASENRASALVALQELLGVDETGARAIAELQWARLTKDTRPHVQQEIEELDAEIRDLDG
jgi:hypothetical protein